jgi:hypothetical protein
MNPRFGRWKSRFGSALSRSTYSETDRTDLNWMTGGKRNQNYWLKTKSSSLLSRGLAGVVDASFFVSIAAVNPSLTIVANALRVGDHLPERLGSTTPLPAI